MSTPARDGLPAPCHVVIVGGGVSGLYLAWRLRDQRDVFVTLLESRQQIGGRYLTQPMPGGFPADLGAMRYLPHAHPILDHLIKNHFGLDTEPLYQSSKSNDPRKHYFRGTRVKQSEIANMFSFSDADVQRNPYLSSGPWITVPPGGDWYNATVVGTDTPATDMTVEEFASYADNPEVLKLGDPCYITQESMADFAAWISLWNEGIENGGYRTIKGGMSQLPQAMLRDLEKAGIMDLKVGHTVKAITEHEGSFSVQAESKGSKLELMADKLILACNKSGFQGISWFGSQDHINHLRLLMAQVSSSPAFKLFLTYPRAWWEDCGLYAGEIYTDLALGRIMAFGERGKSECFATLLASFTYKHPSIFEGLNAPSAAKFKNILDVPMDVTPSKRLVDYAQRQLKAVFGIAEVEEPVCAVCCCWFDHLLMAADNVARVGVNSKELQWEALKPFRDAELYITGDTFPAICKRGSLWGYSEGALLNSERILVNHFGLQPILDGLTLRKE